MKSDEPDMEDELRSEYDLKSLRVRRLGSGRKGFGETTVRLEPDVAAMFPNADAVNEALRFLNGSHRCRGISLLAIFWWRIN